MKSHKKANSLDESPSRTAVSPSRTVRQTNIAGFQKPFDDTAMFDPSTPSQVPHNSNGAKHSPGFESFHRLTNKKMFTSKLFKKNSSSTALPHVSAPTTSILDTSSAPDTPNRISGSTGDLAHFRSDEGTIPAIKGTITHNWGDNRDKQQPVIILNNPPEVDSLSSQDLEPAVRITSLRRDSAISAITIGSCENTFPRAQSADDQIHRRSELARDRHVYNELSKVKSKNRQARIHSHDDIISFEKSSVVSLELLESTVSPLAPGEEFSQLSSGKIDRLKPLSESQERQSWGGKDAHSSDSMSENYSRLSVSFENAPSHDVGENSESETEEEEGSMLLTPDIDEEDDDSSKFSFEMSGLNGRTSSIKYYSKPEPKEAMYIDDVYEDEDFDEDMNFYEDDSLEGDFQLTERTYISNSNSADGASGLQQSVGKSLKKYNDLFYLSDDGKDPEYEEEEVDLMCTTELDEECKVVGDTKGNLEELHNDQGIGSKRPDETILNSDAYPVRKLRMAPPLEKGPPKAIKSFSDIFDLDDEYGDSEDELTDGEEVDQLLDYREEDKDGSGDGDSHLNGNFDNLTSKDSNSQGSKSQDLSGNEPEISEENQSSRIELTNRPKTPIHIFVTPPVGTSTASATISDPHLSPELGIAPLPPPARSQTFKIHDLNCNLDSEVPGLMSNLYFIDETEEDIYNEQNKITDDEYLDEINTVPEDFNFSDSEQDFNSLRSPMRHLSKGSFRSTHSYSGQPIGAAKESTPTRNKLEIKNKTVTFFNYSGDRSPTERLSQSSEMSLVSPRNSKDDYVIFTVGKEGEVFNPVTPTNSFSKPIPDYLIDFSLSPIQENSSSVDNSPSLPLQ